MKQYILQTLNGALSGDVAAILKCVVFAFVIHYLYSKIQEKLMDSRYRKNKAKDMTRTPSQSKLADRGYSKSIIDTPPQVKEAEKNIAMSKV